MVSNYDSNQTAIKTASIMIKKTEERLCQEIPPGGDPMRFQDIIEPTLTVVIFDIETTGLDVNKDKIVQCGAKRYHNGEFEEFKVLVNPLILIPLEQLRFMESE